MPLAYLITFRTYGTWLHGDARGSTDRRHNVFGHPWLSANERLEAYRQGSLQDSPLVLAPVARGVIEATLREVCHHRGWTLMALNARQNHVHAVVGAGAPPERVMLDFKAWSTRRLAQEGRIQRGDRVWSRHGSTRYLWSQAAVEAACHYVLHEQDEQS